MSNATVELNQVEFDMLAVMTSFLLKGTPETRIAKYMHDSKWDHCRVHKFLLKLDLPEGWRLKIWNAYMDRQFCVMSDDAQKLGEELQDKCKRKRHKQSP